MALIICRECKNQVSDQAKSCPNCGALQAGSSTFIQKLAVTVFVSFLLATAYFIFLPKTLGDKKMERDLAAIELCWQDYSRKSNSSSEMRLIAATCEQRESDFKRDYNRNP